MLYTLYKFIYKVLILDYHFIIKDIIIYIKKLLTRSGDKKCVKAHHF